MHRRTRTAIMAPTSAVESPVVQNSSSFSICQSFRSSTSWSHCIRTASKSTTLLPWFLMKLNRGLDLQVQLYGFLVDDDNDNDVNDDDDGDDDDGDDDDDDDDDEKDGDFMILVRVTMMIINMVTVRMYLPNLSLSPWSFIS